MKRERRHVKCPNRRELAFSPEGSYYKILVDSLHPGEIECTVFEAEDSKLDPLSLEPDFDTFRLLSLALQPLQVRGHFEAERLDTARPE